MAQLAPEPFTLARRTAREGTRPLPVNPPAKQATFWHGLDDEPNQQKLFADLDVATPSITPESPRFVRRWAALKEEHGLDAVILIRPYGSTAAYALGNDARTINTRCGHMIRRDAFPGFDDVFICELDSVIRLLRRDGRRVVVADEIA